MSPDRHIQRYARRARSLLKEPAKVYGLDSDLQLLAPGTEPQETAFQLLTCGSDLVLGLADADAFPSLDAHTSAKGARMTGRRLGTSGAQRALAFMTQVIPTFFARIWTDPEFQFEMRALVQAHYPISESDEDALAACEAEFRVMETHEPREDFHLGVETGTRYHLMLMAGEDPDSDPEVVETQAAYARDYFLLTAQRHALALIFDEKFEWLEPRLERPGSMEYESLLQRQIRLLTMQHVAPHWKNFTSPKPRRYGDYGRRPGRSG